MQRLKHVDGLRGLAALYVTGCHAYLTYADRYSADLLPGCHWLAYGRRRWPSSSSSRATASCSRCCEPEASEPTSCTGVPGDILPPYYAAMLLSLTMLAAIPQLNDPVQNHWTVAAFTPGAIGSHLLLIHNYWPAWQHAIDYPMWSLATEWQIYLLFPWLVAVWARRSIGDAVMLALRITFALQVFLMLCPGLGDPWPPQFVTLFALGMAAAACQTSRRWGLHSGLLGLAYLGVEATIGDWLLRTGHQQVQDLLAGGAAACLLIHCAQGSRWASWLGSRVLVQLGSCSYSLYLVHAPILAALFVGLQAWGTSPTLTQLLLLGLGIPLTVVLAYGFYLVFERPFLQPLSKERARSNFPVCLRYVIEPVAWSAASRRAAWTPAHRKSSG